ncbi:MAG: VCBS repeat-containing protein [Myxococcales bacterium]|nr:VCBS repeat-containing protein [Myxococcales bacterium]
MKSPSRVRLFPLLSVLLSGPLVGSCAVDSEDPEEPVDHVAQAVRGDRQRNCTTPCIAGTVCDESIRMCVPDLMPPQIVFPMSGDRLAGRPRLRWSAAAGGERDAVIEICKDPLCSTVVGTVSGIGSGTLASALAKGTHYARAFGRRQRPDGTYLEGATASSVREFFSTGRSAIARGALGIVPDLDLDGRADLGISGSKSSTEMTISVSLSSGRTASFPMSTSYPFGVVPNAFSRSMIFASDTDGDGYPEIATVEQNVVAPNPLVVLRFAYDPVTRKLVERQRLEVAIPTYQGFVSLTPLGDVDGDGFADVGVVRSLPPVVGPSPGSGTLWLQTGVELEILYGARLGWSRRSKTQIESPAATRTFENSPMPVRGVGDVNGDGYGDLAVSIRTTNPDTCLHRARGRVEIRLGSPSGTFSTVLATVSDYFDPRSVGDINGDGKADVGVVRDPHQTVAPIPPSTTCNGSYRLTGYEPGRALVLLGGSAGPLTEVAYTMPVETVAGCTNGFSYGPNFLVAGTLQGAGDLDGDGFDDVAFVSSDSHQGGADRCDSGGSLIRILPGGTGSTLSVAQTVSTRDTGFGNFTGRTRIVADSDASGRSSLMVVGSLKTSIYAGTRGSLSILRQISTSTYYGEVPLGGF